VIPIAAALLVGTVYAATFGFISTDSWNYLDIARSLRRGDACAIDGVYFAVFPCGYPAVIALLSWSLDDAALIAASKLVNLILWISAAWLMHGFVRSWPATLIFALNPISLLIQLVTWSENLMMLAVAGALFAIKRCADRPDAGWTNAFLLSFFLILGGAARYFFVPYAAVLGLAVLACYGRGVLRRTIPGFVLAAVFYGAYLAYNLVHTGFGTGMPRVPAPESAATLITAFVAFVAQQLLDLGGLILVVAILAFLLERTWPVAWRPAPEGLLLAAAGVGYLVLAFLLRFLVQFDFYGPRTVGPGVVLLSAGIAAVVLRRETSRSWAMSAVMTAAALAYSFSVAIGVRDLTVQGRYAALNEGWRFPLVAHALAAYRVGNPPTGTTAVVSFGIPGLPVAMRIAPSIRRYYPPGIALIWPPAPVVAAGPESAAAFAVRLETSAAGDGCYLDFSVFKQDEDLRRHLHREYAADLAQRLAGIAQAGRFVPCAAYLRAGGAP